MCTRLPPVLHSRDVLSMRYTHNPLLHVGTPAWFNDDICLECVLRTIYLYFIPVNLWFPEHSSPNYTDITYLQRKTGTQKCRMVFGRWTGQFWKDWADRRDSGVGYELIQLVCFVLLKGQVSWRNKGERAGQSQLLWTDVVKTSGKSTHGRLNSSPESNKREHSHWGGRQRLLLLWGSPGRRQNPTFLWTKSTKVELEKKKK